METTRRRLSEKEITDEGVRSVIGLQAWIAVITDSVNVMSEATIYFFSKKLLIKSTAEDRTKIDYLFKDGVAKTNEGIGIREIIFLETAASRYGTCIGEYI